MSSLNGASAADLLAFFDQLDAPPPPSLRHNLAALNEAASVADIAAAFADTVDPAKVRFAQQNAVELFWCTQEW
jgi:hypothetical protein